MVSKGIVAGRLVPDVGGGVCQVASTLHAAALFAGLEVVETAPHSRPSTYIPMGLDATVAYPSVDLKLRNPYPYSVIVRLQPVDDGRVFALVYGPERPFKAIYQRTITRRIGYKKEVIFDQHLPLGQQAIEQHGLAGFDVARTLKITGGPRKGTYSAEVHYQPTRRIVRLGTALARLGEVAHVSEPNAPSQRRWQQQNLQLTQ